MEKVTGTAITSPLLQYVVSPFARSWPSLAKSPTQGDAPNIVFVFSYCQQKVSMKRITLILPSISLFTMLNAVEPRRSSR